MAEMPIAQELATALLATDIWICWTGDSAGLFGRLFEGKILRRFGGAENVKFARYVVLIGADHRERPVVRILVKDRRDLHDRRLSLEMF